MHKGISTVELYQITYVLDYTIVDGLLYGSGIDESIFYKKILGSYLDIPIA